MAAPRLPRTQAGRLELTTYTATPLGGSRARRRADASATGRLPRAGRRDEKVAGAYLSPPVPRPLVLTWCNDAVPRERRSPRAPERYAPATFFRAADALRGGDDSPELLPEGPDRAKRGATARRNSARSSGNRRARHLTREHVALADVLAG